jgi:hypothetical protein
MVFGQIFHAHHVLRLFKGGEMAPSSRKRSREGGKRCLIQNGQRVKQGIDMPETVVEKW